LRRPAAAPEPGPVQTDRHRRSRRQRWGVEFMPLPSGPTRQFPICIKLFSKDKRICLV
jgi:hypothetical protein